MKNHKRLLQRLLGLTALILISGLGFIGCGPAVPVGNPNAVNDPLSPFNAYLTSSANGLSASGGGWTCPTSYNVTPSGSGANQSIGNLNEFQVCTSASNPSTIKVSGTTNSPGLCVFAFQGSSLAAQPSCYSVGSSAMAVNLGTANFNIVIIVDSSYSGQMSSCLSGKTTCPPYSEGLVK